MNSTITDHGRCCTILPNDDMPKTGLYQGLKIWAYPGINQNGVYYTLHHPEDSPLMHSKAEFLPLGTYNDIKITMVQSKIPEGWCWFNWTKVEFNHGFGKKRLSMTNCLYDNMMSQIVKDCGCNKLEDCALSATMWNCTAKILMDPYGKMKTPIQCMEACEQYYYVPTLNSRKWAKNPPMCKKWLFTSLKQLTCSLNRTLVETGYAGLCNSATIADTACPVEEGQEKWENYGTLLQFAKDKVVGMNLYVPEFWMEIHETSMEVPMSTLIGAILVILAVGFGFSLMSIPEMLYYAFCSRGGGCICSPIIKNCS